MMRERGDLKDKRGKKIHGAAGVSIRTGCGEVGHPYNGEKGLRATIWASYVTCPACKALPSVAPIFANQSDETD